MWVGSSNQPVNQPTKAKEQNRFLSTFTPTNQRSSEQCFTFNIPLQPTTTTLCVLLLLLHMQLTLAPSRSWWRKSVMFFLLSKTLLLLLLPLLPWHGTPDPSVSLHSTWILSLVNFSLPTNLHRYYFQCKTTTTHFLFANVNVAHIYTTQTQSVIFSSQFASKKQRWLVQFHIGWL